VEALPAVSDASNRVALKAIDAIEQKMVRLGAEMKLLVKQRSSKDCIVFDRSYRMYCLSLVYREQNK